MDKKVLIKEKLAELVDLLFDGQSNTAAAVKEVPTTAVVAETPAPKSSKKATKKTTKKTAKDAKPSKTVFSKDDGPKGAAEVKLFQEHWAELDAEAQSAYVNGEINSLGESMNVEEVEEIEENVVEAEAKDEITADDIRAKLMEIVSEKGEPEAIGLLGDFGAKKVTELKDKDYANFMSAADGLLGKDQESVSSLFE